MLDAWKVRLDDIVLDSELRLQRVVAITPPRVQSGVFRFDVVPWKGMNAEVEEGKRERLTYYGKVEVVGNARSAPTTAVPPIVYDVPDEDIQARSVAKLQEIVAL